MHSRRRHFSGSHMPKQHGQPQAPTPEAQAAASHAFQTLKPADQSLSAAAAAAALMSRPTPTTDVASVQTKRMQKRASNGSVRSLSPGSRASVTVQRPGSSGSLVGRTLRTPSPRRGSPAQMAPPFVPPVPPVPAATTSRPRASSLEPPARAYSPVPARPGGRGASLDYDRRLAAAQTARQPPRTMPAVEETPPGSPGANRRSVNFSRPMSPQNPPSPVPPSPPQPQRRTGWFTGPVVSGQLPRGAERSHHAVRERVVSAPIHSTTHVRSDSGELDKSRWSASQYRDEATAAYPAQLDDAPAVGIAAPERPRSTSEYRQLPAPVAGMQSSRFAEESDAAVHRPEGLNGRASSSKSAMKQTTSHPQSDIPDRSGSPTKSAMKQKGQTADQRVDREREDSSRKKSVRLNVQLKPGDELGGMKSSRYAPPTPIKRFHKFDDSADDSDDDIMKPSSQLPPFGSIRSQHSHEAENPKSEHPQEHRDSPGSFHHGIPELDLKPLPPVVTSVEGSGHFSDSDEEAEVVEEKSTARLSVSSDDTIRPNSATEVVPPVIRSETPHAMPGAFPDWDTDDDKSLKASQINRLDEDHAGGDDASSVSGDSIYSDAEEHLTGTGFFSLDTVLQRAAAKDQAPKELAPDAAPVAPLGEESVDDGLDETPRISLEHAAEAKATKSEAVESKAAEPVATQVTLPDRDVDENTASMAQPSPSRSPLQSSKWSPSNLLHAMSTQTKSLRSKQNRPSTSYNPTAQKRYSSLPMPHLASTTSLESASSFERKRPSNSPPPGGPISMRRSMRVSSHGPPSSIPAAAGAAPGARQQQHIPQLLHRSMRASLRSLSPPSSLLSSQHGRHADAPAAPPATSSPQPPTSSSPPPQLSQSRWRRAPARVANFLRSGRRKSSAVEKPGEGSGRWRSRFADDSDEEDAAAAHNSRLSAPPAPMVAEEEEEKPLPVLPPLRGVHRRLLGGSGSASSSTDLRGETNSLAGSSAVAAAASAPAAVALASATPPSLQATNGPQQDPPPPSNANADAAEVSVVPSAEDAAAKNSPANGGAAPPRAVRIADPPRAAAGLAASRYASPPPPPPSSSPPPPQPPTVAAATEKTRQPTTTSGADTDKDRPSSPAAAPSPIHHGRWRALLSSARPGSSRSASAGLRGASAGFAPAATSTTTTTTISGPAGRPGTAGRRSFRGAQRSFSAGSLTNIGTLAGRGGGRDPPRRSFVDERGDAPGTDGRASPTVASPARAPSRKLQRKHRPSSSHHHHHHQHDADFGSGHGNGNGNGNGSPWPLRGPGAGDPVLGGGEVVTDGEGTVRRKGRGGGGGAWGGLRRMVARIH